MQLHILFSRRDLLYNYIVVIIMATKEASNKFTCLVNFVNEFDASKKKVVLLFNERRKTFSRDVFSKILWPHFNQLMEMLEIFIKDLLKETVEIVFKELLASSTSKETNKLTPHLQEVVAHSLLHHSSKDDKKAAFEMSSYLLPHPELWRDSFDSYKQYLLAKCDEVVPVFDGANGIDETFKEIFESTGTTLSLSSAVIPIKASYCYKEYQVTDLVLSSVDGLSTILHLYHGIHCVVTKKSLNYFSSIDCKLFQDPQKVHFQKLLGEVPGDYLEYFYRCVTSHPDDPYLYFEQCKNLMYFLWSLTHSLCDAVSTFMKDHFDIEL
ncbi:uncharacterized protein LOC135347325 [Halichondria panicea]|uniref:uncharacterized protein LOC135347325 n=1 Tax=Halichondria panicea TaxID=6063 RepID=UPI00312B49CD